MIQWGTGGPQSEPLWLTRITHALVAITVALALVVIGAQLAIREYPTTHPCTQEVPAP